MGQLPEHKIIQVDFGSYDTGKGRKSVKKYFVGMTRQRNGYERTMIYMPSGTSVSRLIGALLRAMATGSTDVERFPNGWRWYLLFGLVILYLLLSDPINMEVCSK